MKKLFMSIYNFLFTRKKEKETITTIKISVDEKPISDQVEKLRQDRIKREENSKPPVFSDGEIKTSIREKEKHIYSEMSILSTLTEKEMYMFDYVKTKGGFVSPTETGRSYGRQIKGRSDYNSGHARACLVGLVKKGLLMSNSEGHYKYIQYKIK